MWGRIRTNAVRVIAGAVVTLAFAVIAAIIVEGKWNETLAFLESLTTSSWALALVVAAAFGGLLALAFARNRKVAALRHENASLMAENAILHRAYSVAATYWKEVWQLLVALRYGLIEIPSLSSISTDVADLCLNLPAKRMSAETGTDVALSLWVERGEELVMVSGPQHRGMELGVSITKARSLIYRTTVGLPERPTNLTIQDMHRLHDDIAAGDSDPEIFELLPPIDELTGEERYDDLQLFYQQGYRSMRGQPLMVNGAYAWLVGLGTRPRTFRRAEEYYIRCIGIVLEFAAIFLRDVSTKPTRKRRGRLN